MIVWSAAACSFDEVPGSGTCVQGQQALCSCPGGAVGVRTCEATSAFGSCACGGANVGGALAGNPGDGAQEPDTAGTAAPMPGAAGTSATQVDKGASGQGADAQAGSGANDGGDGADAAADAGAGDGGGDNAGSGGAGGAGAGGAGSGGTDGDSEPRSGSPYSRCSSDQPCDEGLVCAPTGSGNSGNGELNDVGYCTAFCDAMNGGACAQPSSGSVPAICFPFANVCALIDCQNAQCPKGMRCIQVSNSGTGNPWGGSGALFTCAYEAR
jgi:hypothetical protein